MRKWDRDILRVAAEIGISDARIEYGGKHPAIVGTVQGREFRRAFAGSPSDAKRGLTKARCDMKREMRLRAALTEPARGT